MIMEIISHRGATLEYPENSIPAFERALEIGVDAIEADVLLTKDLKCVIRHDDTVQKDGIYYFVNELDYDELRRIDIGMGYSIPTLDDFLGHFSGKCQIILDIKAFGAAEKVLRYIPVKEIGSPNVHITSFIFSEIDYVRHNRPDLECSIVMTSVPEDFDNIFKGTLTDQISVFRGYLSKSIVEAIKSTKRHIRVYPVNLLREAEKYASWGVDGIFTDDPKTMQHLRK
jgi:glycerophosphoryl diester phosphodiesterase